MGKALFTYTTKIDPVKTIGEIQVELVEHGARSIKLDYEGTQIVSMSFLIDTPSGQKWIKLPCDHKPVLEVLTQQRYEGKITPKFVNAEQAYRVAWRIIYYWVKAQMAILETEMVTIDQIFLPYKMANDGKTFYEKMIDSKFQITGGQDDN